MDLRIDSRPSRARVAQLAEQGTLNPKVQGSIPCASTNMLCLRRAYGLHVVAGLAHCVMFEAFDSLIDSLQSRLSLASEGDRQD